MSVAKHERYGASYLPGDVYWGLGIENETYIEFENGIQYPRTFIRNQKRERYSVDYWKTYKPECIASATEDWIAAAPPATVTFPLLLNAHSLTKTDRFGESMTTYTKNPSPNPKFCGTTLYQDLCTFDRDVFMDGFDKWWTQDGDTIEFMTQNYYCAKMEDVIDELIKQKTRWMQAFNAGLRNFPDRELALRSCAKYPEQNHGLAVFLTNRKNISIFNNGTYHINITLPTYLDKDARIANMELFETQHRCAARLFQWISPFLVAKFGSGDIFSRLRGGGGSSGHMFPSGSQRLCASRYVSVGMYDTETMPRGKIVTIPNTVTDGRWYDTIYDMSGCAYVRLPALGVDINYNKHWNHGLEFRIFDWFPESKLEELFRLLIWMCDESLERKCIDDPRKHSVWNSVLARVIWEGSSAMLSTDELNELSTVLRISFPSSLSSTSTAALEVYDCIWKTWMLRWNNSIGTCTERMIRHRLPLPVIPAPPPPPAPAPAPAPAAPAPAPAPAPARPSVPPTSPSPSVPIVTTPKKWFFCC